MSVCASIPSQYTTPISASPINPPLVVQSEVEYA
jgi:hypothetical protein